MSKKPGKFHIFISFICCCISFLVFIIAIILTIRSCISLDMIEVIAFGACAAIAVLSGIKFYKQYESKLLEMKLPKQIVSDHSQDDADAYPDQPDAGTPVADSMPTSPSRCDSVEEPQLPTKFDRPEESPSARADHTYSVSFEYRPPVVISQGNIKPISDTDMVVLLRHYRKVDEIKTKVKGVSYRNNDGTDRQSILAHCHAGDQLRFKPYTYKGSPAYAVYCDWGQIGNLSAELAEEIAEEIAARKNPCLILGEILNVSGGYHGEYFGCNICLNIYEKY